MRQRYLILKQSDVLLFYVDRHLTKKFWWSYDLDYAMYFTSKDEAQKIVDGLKYGKFSIITEDKAREMRKEVDREHERNHPEYDDHPFSSEALGQK